ncbi:MAG: M48 family metalloprotease [Pseudomonadota bacterium]
MNFFAQQDSARRRTRWLVLWFAAAVISILLMTNAIVVMTVINLDTQGYGFQVPDGAWLRANVVLIAITSAVVLAAVAGASLFRMAGLSGGGGGVARSMGGTLVPSDTADADRRRLRNVVEEIALASGVPVPEIYVLEKESGINAFAAGYAAGDAAVAVSRGCLELLDRDELQGVIAHEFSHILNGDMRLNIRLVGVLFGILVIGLAGRQILRVAHHGSRKAFPLVAAGLGLLIIGFAGLFFSRLIQAAVSRQREVLADASAVQFTRNPDGIAGALKKIAASTQGSVLEEADATEVSHMLFADGLKRSWFATHPSIEDRIRAIDPNFQASELRELRARMALGPGHVSAKPPAPPGAAAFTGESGSATEIEATPDAITAGIGNPSWGHVAYAEALLDRLDSGLVDAAHDLRRAVDLVFALGLSPSAPVRERQLTLIERHMGRSHRERTEALVGSVDGIDPLHRLPLVELAFPALKRRPDGAVRIYIEVLEKLIHSDGDVDVFEFALARLVRVYLVESINPAAEALESRDLSLNKAKGALEHLLAILAHHGHEDEGQAAKAFSAGWNHLFPMDTVSYRAPERWVDAAEVALERADLLEPLAKEALIEALTATLSHDGKITLKELELLRAICASIHCPMPPSIRAT